MEESSVALEASGKAVVSTKENDRFAIEAVGNAVVSTEGREELPEINADLPRQVAQEGQDTFRAVALIRDRPGRTTSRIESAEEVSTKGDKPASQEEET